MAGVAARAGTQALSALVISQVSDLEGAVAEAEEPRAPPRPTSGSHPCPELELEEAPGPYLPITVHMLHTGKCLQTKPGSICEANSPAPRPEGKSVQGPGQRQALTLLYAQPK